MFVGAIVVHVPRVTATSAREIVDVRLARGMASPAGLVQQRNMRQVGFLVSIALATACGETPAPARPAPPTTTRPASASVTPASAPTPNATAALLGTTPPEWQADRWMNSAPLTLAGLRGSVVLVRWWTAGCPFCSATAPALRTLHRDYSERGLKVIGMYHHKEDTPFEPSVYEETARKYEFTFPVAFDPDWKTLESWMRDASGNGVSTGWTSVTFVLDKRGVVRHVHPGGQYVAGEPVHDELTKVIERLLAEPIGG
jgi:peroxiredoxin